MSRPHTGIQGFDKYVDSVLDGDIDVPKYVRLAVERHVNDLNRSKKDDFPYYFNNDAAVHFFNYCYYELIHYDGELAGQPLELRPWQLFVFGSIFGWRQRETNLRRFRQATIIIPKKNGKSIMGGAIALYIAECDGEQGAQIYLMATNRTQAMKLSYRSAVEMIEMNEPMQERFNVNKSIAQLRISCHASRSFIEPLTAKPKNLDGFKPHCAINDETKDWEDDALLNVIEDGMILQQQPLMVNITTAGDNKMSLGYQQQEYAQKVLDGELSDEQTFGIVFSITDEEEKRWDDIEVWEKVNPNFDVMNADHVRQMITKAKESPTKKHAILTKHLNRWQDGFDKWADMDAWKASGTDEYALEDFKKIPCYIHADLASTQDICAVCKLFPVGQDRRIVFGRYYLPEHTVETQSIGRRAMYKTWAEQGLLTIHPGKEVILERVQEDIEHFANEFSVKSMGFDDWNAKQMMNHFVSAGYDVVNIQQSPKNLSEPMKTVMRWIHYKPSKLLHPNDDIMTWAISNVIAKEDNNDNLFPRKPHPNAKIDPAVALFNLVAMDIAEPLPRKIRRKPRIWSV